MAPMRERLAIVFMTANVMATLVLGGAIAYDFAHKGSATVQPTAGAVAGQAYTSSPNSSSGTAAPSGSAPTSAPTSSAQPASSGSAPAGHAAPAGKTSAA